MPKIPEASAIQMPRAATPGMIPAIATQRTLQRTSDQLFQLGAQYKQMQQQSELVKISSGMDRQLLDLRLEIEQNPEINTAEMASQAYAARAGPIIEQATGGSQWKSVRTAIGARGAAASISGMAAVSRVGYAREVDAAKATLDEDAQTAAKKYALAEDPIGQAGAISQFKVNLEMESHIGEEERGKRLRLFDRDRVSQRAIHLANQGRFGEAREYLEDPDVTSVLGTDDIYTLTRTIDIEETRQETHRKKAQTAAEEITVHSLLSRILRPTQEEPMPTLSEILDANLGRIETEHFEKLITEKANGKDVDYLNAYEVNEFYKGVRSGEITTFAQLSPMIGNGLPIEEAEKLMKIIEAREKNPAQKALDKRVEQFLTGYKAPIAGSTMMGVADPMGGPQNFAFRVEVERRIAEAIENGEDPYRLLTPGTKEFIGPLHTNFKRTQEEIMESQLQAVADEFGETVPEPKSPPTKSFEEFVEEQRK